MSARPLRFCLVTSAHVCNNPRLVKEADTLHEAGHDVRVVAVNARADHAAADDTVMCSRRWRLARVAVDRHGHDSRARWLAASVAQRAARLAFDAGVGLDAVRDQAASRFVWPLAAAAAAEPADVVIAHNLQALPAAARAARRLGARLGFDIEDLHTGELPDGPAHEAQRALIAAVERRYLPLCDYLTASSEGIADEIVRVYGVPRPTVLLNVFPAAAASAGPRVPTERRGPLPSLYWYSQVIGPGRGLEEALAAVARLGVPVQLHLRGAWHAGYRETLEALIARLALPGPVHFWPPAPPDDLVALASQHDVGLALEQPSTRNRALCVTNKLFTYLLAGLAVAATDTPGQRRVLVQAPGVGFLYPPGDAEALAAGLRALLADPRALAEAKRSALAAATTRFAWEHERDRLLGCLTGGRYAPAPAPTAALEVAS